jgi:pSer/pThr/pTyr-binding forkhead associated (FHA) protein
MLYLIRLHIRHTNGMSLPELREVWHRDVAATQEPHGYEIVQSFKVVGQPTIFAIAEFPDNETLDEGLARFSIVEEFGDAVEIEVIPVLSYGESATLRGAGAEPAVARSPVDQRSAPAEHPTTGETEQTESGSITAQIRGLDESERTPAEPETPARAEEKPERAPVETAAAQPSAPSGSRASLRSINEPTAGEVFEISQPEITIGRSRENSIWMDVQKLSRQHARIEFKGGDYWLTDLGSSNGTSVNQVRLNAPHQLRPGDVIRMCGAQFIFEAPGGTARHTPPLPEPSEDPSITGLIRSLDTPDTPESPQSTDGP